MKKCFLIIMTLFLIISLTACSSSHKVSAPVSDRIVITIVNTDEFIEISDTKIISQITEHINCFEYERSVLSNDKAVFDIEWFDENSESLIKISLCEDGKWIIYDNHYYEVVGDHALDIYYFEQLCNDLKNRTIYRLPERLVRVLFGCATTEGFWDKYIALYDSCEDFRETAYIDDDNVILMLTEEQKLAWLSDNDTDIEKFDALNGVEVAEDYSRITITKPKSKMYEFIYNNYNLYTQFDMVVRQIILGNDPATIVAEIILIDEETGETIYSAKWPDEEIKFEW